MIDQLRDWVESCAELTMDSVLRLSDTLPSVGYLSGNLYSRLKAVNTDFAADLDADPCYHVLQALQELEVSMLVLCSSTLDDNDDALNALAEKVDPTLLIGQFKMHWAAITFDREEHLKRYTRGGEGAGLQPLHSENYLSKFRKLLETVSNEVSKSFRIESLGLSDEEKEIYTRLWASMESEDYEHQVRLAFEYYRVLEMVTDYYEQTSATNALASGLRERLHQYHTHWTSRDVSNGALISKDEAAAIPQFFAQIELVRSGKDADGALQRVYFPIPPEVRAQINNPLVKKEMEDVMENVKRGNPEEKLDDFLDR